ncbi:MAG TPA: DUF1801 domain-containing protein, partial [Sediminibacterium sp.]|nr:DUF1801 domain-containing protein [Sediminibacterium sp.]
MPANNPATVDAYIRSFPKPVADKLKQMRAIIRQVIPDAEELISYRMPGYRMGRMLVWFAGYQHHIGFYPGADGIAAFQPYFGSYHFSKGAVQFPLDADLP